MMTELPIATTPAINSLVIVVSAEAKADKKVAAKNAVAIVAEAIGTAVRRQARIASLLVCVLLGLIPIVPGHAAEPFRIGLTLGLFGVFTPASRYTVGMLKLALLNDLTTIAIAHANDPFSTSAGEGARKWASKLGLQVVMFEKFEKGQRDLSALAEKAKLADASLLLQAPNNCAFVRWATRQWPSAFFAIPIKKLIEGCHEQHT